jgi:acetoin utilization deacetylase AcuC-like enzyme
MAIGVISHQDCIKHDPGAGHPEQPERVQVIDRAIRQFNFTNKIEYYASIPATREQLERVHDVDYLDKLFAMAPIGETISLDADTHMCPDTLQAALLSAGAAPMAVDLVMKGDVQAVFCNVRPPGHHAETNKAMGFCFFANIAVGVAHAISVHKIKRVAIIDFDLHHGNGTQQIFQDNPDVLFCSSFEHPLYPGYDETMDNEHIVAVPLSAGTRGDVYREKVKAAWFDKIIKFKPEFIFISAGFDAHEKDPLGNLNLDADDYVWITKEIAKLATQLCNGRIVSMLEGGYNLEALAESVPPHVDSLV